MNLAVRLRARGDLLLPLHRLGGDREQLAESHEPDALGALVEKLLLDARRESSNRPAIANESSGVSGSGALDVGRGQLGEAREQRQRTLDVGRLGRIVLVVDRLDAAGRERPALGQLEQPESRAALDDDVQPPVLEALRRPR